MKALIFLLCLVAALPIEAQNLTVVIIGGGPAGLTTAIEAHESGAKVCLVEKREAYSRSQGLFLFDSSILLLEKWKIDFTPINVVDVGEGKRFGFVAINVLEEQLHARVQALGIPKIQGECLSVDPEKRSVAIVCQGRVLNLPYDIIVAADGCHSVTREAVGIQVNNFGHAFAISALIPLAHQKMEISDAIQKGDIFAKRILSAEATIIFAQSMTNKELSLAHIASACGWHEEAALARAGKATILDGIEVNLQQAVSFSDSEKGAILVGDAAACASFLEGMGANTAFRTAACAGKFFAKLQKQEPQAYESFNEAMKKTTDELIEDSRYLFSKDGS